MPRVQSTLMGLGRLGRLLLLVLPSSLLLLLSSLDFVSFSLTFGRCACACARARDCNRYRAALAEAVNPVHVYFPSSEPVGIIFEGGDTFDKKTNQFTRLVVACRGLLLCCCTALSSCRCVVRCVVVANVCVCACVRLWCSVLIGDFEESSPAPSKGLRVGDVLIAVNERSVEGSSLNEVRAVVERRFELCERRLDERRLCTLSLPC